MKLAVPKEIVPGERRVSLTPEVVGNLAKAGFEVLVESGAGKEAGLPDDAYSEAGATVLDDTAGLFSQADVILKVQPPTQNDALGRHEIDLMSPGSALIAFLQPLTSPELVQKLTEQKITSFSMEMIPRITRAQSMDALSSQATLAGYKAVLMAADSLGKLMPMMTTAAGTVRPARVLILGAGVAGLQAIATAKRLGAIVEAFDTRAVVKEQVESLGAKFLALELEHEDAEEESGYAKELADDVQRREQELIVDSLKRADVVITTAAIPGKRAPILITEDAVNQMQPGAVIVDLAAETGGNCELTKAGEVVEHRGVFINGPVNLPATIPVNASQLYAKNVSTLLNDLVEEGELELDLEDEIAKGTCVTHDGQVVNEQVRAALQGTAERAG